MNIQPTSQKAVDDALGVLMAHKEAWVALGIHERIAILGEVREDLLKVADRWISASIDAKGIPAGTQLEGEEWGMLMIIFRELRLLRKSLADILKNGRPRVNGFAIRPNGQVAAQVFPQTLYDRILYRGFTGEVLMEPGITDEEAVRTQARIYHDKNHQGKIVVVLGAGNVSSLVPGDFLYKLFVEDKVVVLKTNPVNAYLGPLIEEGFRALVRRGVLRVIRGGAEEGAYLCRHPAVDEIHLTGSDRTFEAIVFGIGPEGKRRKAERAPLITKKFTAELGNVTPVIIVPGPWSDSDVMEQAVEIASWHVVNAAFNCVAPRMIIQHKGWHRRDALVEAFGDVLTGVKTRKAYYPRAKELFAAFVAAHPNARQYGDAGGERTPWTFIEDLDPRNREDICFTTEAYCSLFAETALEAPSTADFINRAVEFANNTLWGTLHATLIVHPKSLNDPQVASAVERAIDRLNYGTIGINVRGDYAYGLMLAPWGGFPLSDIYNVQSGIGFTNNVLMFDRPQKSVFRGPFHKRPNPLVITSKRMLQFFKKLAYFEASPSVRKLLGLIWTALRS
jgi:acyl-CoA reductase-like NAD-dependent aldehyde dehydrogenase